MQFVRVIDEKCPQKVLGLQQGPCFIEVNNSRYLMDALYMQLLTTVPQTKAFIIVLSGFEQVWYRTCLTGKSILTEP